MEKTIPEEVRRCLEVNRRYIEQSLAKLDNLLDEIDYLESEKVADVARLKSLKEEYERELIKVKDQKELYDNMLKQTEEYISK